MTLRQILFVSFIIFLFEGRNKSIIDDHDASRRFWISAPAKQLYLTLDHFRREGSIPFTRSTKLQQLAPLCSISAGRFPILQVSFQGV
jgi:hypothetical protein